MKSYDETVSTVFDRIHAYNIKKQHRAVLARRITASCCAVSLLGGSVWYLNHAPEDAPVTMITDGNTDTTTVRNSTFPSSATATETQDTLSTTAPVTAAPSGSTTESKTKAPSTTITTTPTQTTAAPSVSTTQSATESTTATTAPERILITAEGPDVYGDIANGMLSRDEKYISPALQEMMKLYDNKDVVYSVIVEIALTIEDYEECDNFANTNEEVMRLTEKVAVAYEAFLKAKEQAGSWTQDVTEKYHIHKDLSHQRTYLHDELAREYISVIRERRTTELSLVSNDALISLATDTRFIPFFAYDSNYAFFIELTADQINKLAERGGYVIRLVFPEGDQPMDMPE